MELITNINYEQYLRKHSTIFISEEEFQADFDRIKYIKKLITRYIENGDSELRERLILNHLIVLTNVFGSIPVIRVLFLRMPDTLIQLKPFLIFLSILPKYVYNINGKNKIDTDLIPMDSNIINKLRNL